MSALAAIGGNKRRFGFDEPRFLPHHPATDLEALSRFGIVAKSHLQIRSHTSASSCGHGLGHGLIEQRGNNSSMHDPM
jgi:hypothetical protein